MVEINQLESTTRPVHGGLNLRELRSLGLNPEDVLDFSASINPLGPTPGVADAIAKVNLATYPDSDCLELREALAERLDMGVERILAGNGSTELIHLIARAYLGKSDGAIVFAPTFGEYAGACHVQGGLIGPLCPASASIQRVAWATYCGSLNLAAIAPPAPPSIVARTTIHLQRRTAARYRRQVAAWSAAGFSTHSVVSGMLLAESWRDA